MFRTVPFTLAALLAALAAGAAGADAQERAPLFASAAPLEMRLKADYKKIARDRDTLSKKRYPATLTYTDSAGAPVTIPAELMVRGHFRLRASTCRFPPLRVLFHKDSVKGTLFEKQKSLKLVTHCQNSDEFEQNLLEESLLYPIYNLFTPRSFLNRLAHVTYVEQSDTTNRTVRHAFFIEHEEDMAKRNHGKIIEAKGGRWDDVNQDEATIMAVYQYFIGNTDWSIAALHNIRLFQPTDSPTDYYAIPYDFDWSGVVSAAYARPDPRLPTRTVRERIFRGPCRTAEQLAPVFAKFKEKKDTIYALFTNLQPLHKDRVKDALGYFNEFYDTINDPRRAQREFRSSCEG